MDYDAQPSEVLRQISSALDASGVPYMLTGSFASSLYGRPRTTQDLDLVIAPDGQSLDRLMSHFPTDRYYASRSLAMEALRKESLFNVVDLESGWKIDFIIRKSREFSRVEFDRRVVVDLLGVPVAVASPEDVVIAKLEWAKRSGSDRQIDDAGGIIRSKGSDLDRAYVERWVAALDLAPQWAAAQLRTE